MKERRISLAHGAGGKLSHDLVQELFLPYIGSAPLQALDDSAVIPFEKGQLAFTTDAYVVKPLFFPGGDIGRLAVCGTVNDLAMVGAQPLGLSCSFILEEGLLIADIERVLASMQTAGQEAGAQVVAGDTKVVEHDAVEGIFITTAGIGQIPTGVAMGSARAVPGDAVIVSGPLGDHEIAVLLARGEFSLQGEVKSDCAPLNKLVAAMLAASSPIHCLRDPTRGGMATVLWEIAHASGVGVVVEEEEIPIRGEVRAVCDLLGFDPYYLANEGRLIAFAPERTAKTILEAMQQHPLGKGAKLIGRIVADHPGTVLLHTTLGGHRILEPLSGVQFPRIC
jgi:hydrogenase expression/formation protein HypE